VIDLLFRNTWPWWAAGLGIGVTAVGLVYVTGKNLRVASAYGDLGSWIARKKPMSWKVALILGIPLGAALAMVKGWSWTFLFGRMDALTSGNVVLKVLLLLLGGFLLGFGARWAGGCTTGHTLTGIGSRSIMSIVVTIIFLAVGALMAQLLVRGM
jgi:uncharacterized protein